MALTVWLGLAACSAPGSGSGTSHSPTPVAASSPTAGTATPSTPGSPGATASPSTSASPTSAAVAYGVLVSPPSSGKYTVSLVGTDGRVAASATATAPPMVTCGNTAAGLVPATVSTSDSRLYFLDAQGAVHFLAPNGATGRATTVPNSTASRRSVFSVSPDDNMIAVAVIDFTSGGASTKLYVDSLAAGGGHTLIFSQSGSYVLWPMGWHAKNLVLGKVPSCTQGGGPTCCGAQELHLVDPTSAFRRATLGGTSCITIGAPSPAGDVCENPAFTSADVLDWNGGTRRAFAITGPTPAFIQPSSGGGPQGFSLVAIMNGADTVIQDGGQVLKQFTVCGWIDDSHILSGGDAQQQPLVGNAFTGAVTPVAAIGLCAGRIPGGL